MAGRKFGEFGKLSMISQTKTTKLVLTINSLLNDLLIRQTFFRQILEMSQSAKLSYYMVNQSLYLDHCYAYLMYTAIPCYVHLNEQQCTFSCIPGMSYT